VWYQPFLIAYLVPSIGVIDVLSNIGIEKQLIKFLILGMIPGTTIQLDFYPLMVLLLMLSFFALGLAVYRNKYRIEKYYQDQKMLDLLSI